MRKQLDKLTYSSDSIWFYFEESKGISFVAIMKLILDSWFLSHLLNFGRNKGQAYTYKLLCDLLTRWKTHLMDLRRSFQHCYYHVWTRLDKSGPVWMSLDQFGQVWTSMNKSEPVWMSLDKYDRIWTSLDKSGWVWTRLDKSGPVWTSLDQSGQVWTSLDQSGQVFTSLDKSGWVAKSGWVWTSLDESGQVWTSLDKFKQDGTWWNIFEKVLTWLT